MIRHIHVLGASGSGTTTLGRKLEEVLGYGHFDTDDFFWLPTKPKFQEIRPKEERLRLLNEVLKSGEKWVLTGSLCGWGDPLIDQFDLVVFLRIPPDIRMERLRTREKERYGEAIEPGQPQHEAYVQFIEWATKYDHGGPDMRSKAMHDDWLSRLECPVLRIEEDISVDDKIAMIMEMLDGE